MAAESTRLQFDRGIEDECAPDLYHTDRVARGVDGFASVGDKEIADFAQNGYLVVHNAFGDDQVQAALDALLDIIDGNNAGFAGILQFEAHTEALIEQSPADRRRAVRKLQDFVEYDARLQAVAAHAQLLGALSRLIGREPELFADQAMLKPAGMGREKPWHQDHAYFAVPMGTPIVGVWIALDEATPQNGCMHIIPGSHREGAVVHFSRRDWQICDTDVAGDRVVAVPLKPGGCLFFDGLVHHGTPPNRSPHSRRALQLHYIPTGTARITTEERMAVFGSEGKDVSC